MKVRSLWVAFQLVLARVRAGLHFVAHGSTLQGKTMTLFRASVQGKNIQGGYFLTDQREALFHRLKAGAFSPAAITTVYRGDNQQVVSCSHSTVRSFIPVEFRHRISSYCSEVSRRTLLTLCV